MTLRSPRFILSYSSYYGHTFEEFLRIAHEYGFRAVQLTPDQAPNLYSEFHSERRAALRRYARELGVSLHLHNVFYDINPVSLVPEVSELALRITEQVFDLAADLGAESVTVHPGYMFRGWRRDAVQRARFWHDAIGPLARLGAMARERGVKLLLENGSYFITTKTGFRPWPLHIGIEPEEFLRIVEMCGNDVGVTLDINKAIHSDIAPLMFVQQMGMRVVQLQISTGAKYRDEIESVTRALAAGGALVSFVFEGSKQETESAMTTVARLLT